MSIVSPSKISSDIPSSLLRREIFDYLFRNSLKQSPLQNEEVNTETRAVMEPHVISLPRWIIVIRVLQGIFALIVLGAAAYGLSQVAAGVSTLILNIPKVETNMTIGMGFCGLLLDSDHHRDTLRNSHLSSPIYESSL